jgi:hypothetical protein
VGLGLPGESRRVFDDSNIDRILAGESFIEPVPQKVRERMLGKNIVRLHKREIGEPSLEPIKSADEVIRLAGRKGAFDLNQEFGVAKERSEAFDITTRSPSRLASRPCATLAFRLCATTDAPPRAATCPTAGACHWHGRRNRRDLLLGLPRLRQPGPRNHALL